jgi:hypothetical protein
MLQGLDRLHRGLVAGMSPDEWTSRPFEGGNMLGFTAWHVTATQDWAVHTWVRNVPEVRDGAPWTECMAAVRDIGPFGMTRAEADRVAEATNPDVVGGYSAAVCESITRWLETSGDGWLEHVSDARAHGMVKPQHRTEGYVAEVADMYELPAWKLLTGACYGHARGHIGEIDLALQMMRAAG